MKILHDQLMSGYTTLHIGGGVKNFYIPENEQELINLVKEFDSKKTLYRILANGSNVLVNSKGLKRNVVCVTESCKSLVVTNQNVYAGCSVNLQTFINMCIKNNLYGNEFLASVPGSIGGAIYMNAGRGKCHGNSISDCISFVRVFDGRNITDIPKELCGFSYRKSIFQDRDWVILGATFTLKKQDAFFGLEKIKDRLTYARCYQDNSMPNAGSIFSKGNHKIFTLLKGLRHGGAQFSKKTANWINNINNASSTDVLFLITIARLLNYMVFCKTTVEINYWSD
jgi:UDP-N-acetylmuramate dehydrogenase